MKILSIGNSFSVDAHAYLHTLAKQREIDLKLVNLAIGGCSLQTHWENVEQNNANYGLCIDGEQWAQDCVTIEEILKSDTFDVVTLQQVSHFSGKYETYEPYLKNLAEYVKKFQPNAKLYFHRTWAYEIDSNHSEFHLYDNDQKKMFEALCAASIPAAKSINAKIIPSGNVIQAIREQIPKFDYKNGGESLCCDGFHMSHTWGRYAVAMTWLTTLTDKKAEPMPFMELDATIAEQICTIINQIIF